jgi:hypothetical protein
LQVEAYRRAWNINDRKWTAIGSMIIRLDKEDDNESAVHWVKENHAKLYGVFKSVLEIYNAQKKGIEEEQTATGVMMGVTTSGTWTIPKDWIKASIKHMANEYDKHILGMAVPDLNLIKPKRKYTKKKVKA